MELKNHWQIIKKYRWLIIATALIITALSFLICLPQKAKFEATASFIIQPLDNLTTAENNYYSLQSSQLVGDTLMSWTITPQITSEIFEQAQVNPENLENYFHAKRYSPQNIVVKFISQDEKSAQKLAQNLISVFNDKSAQEWNDFAVKSSEPIITIQKPNSGLYSVIGLIIGVTFGLILAYLHWYFKEN